MVFNQVRQGRISDNIVAQIKNAILSGTYNPGDKLPSEKELERLFNVSRVPLREALRSLEEMGLILIKPGVLGGALLLAPCSVFLPAHDRGFAQPSANLCFICANLWQSCHRRPQPIGRATIPLYVYKAKDR